MPPSISSQGSNNSTAGASTASWQAKLQSGRTAWSSTVEVNGQVHRARYWYDGAWINNAREDAAEVALQWMGIAATPRSPHQTQRFFGAITT
ncbi:hypothetical protein H2203_002210 [Taxawa tesnikishii (nom. ined.)]|nr:hypothetical protein H2203_002210 [Dothideales sp. JES 119]